MPAGVTKFKEKRFLQACTDLPLIKSGLTILTNRYHYLTALVKVLLGYFGFSKGRIFLNYYCYSFKGHVKVHFKC